ncbi:TolC family outer membrane protein [Pistricoccus aurantiacus]|uniref:TolC family outer membrane protein n=1 Tax=Pistricoccus aurantiacus TaxID=1883414 RepID=UPI00363DC8F5
MSCRRLSPLVVSLRQASASRPRLPRRVMPWLAGSLLTSLALANSVQAADLLAITRDALDTNAEIASIRSQLEAAEAFTDVERGALLPQVDLSGSASHNRTYSSQGGDFTSQIPGLGAGVTTSDPDDNFETASIDLNATQALFSPTSAARLEQAREQYDQQALQLEVTRQQLLFNVSQAYFEILRAYEVLEARRAQEKAIARQYEQSRERFDVGLIAITDVYEAQATYDLARAQRIAAESNLQVRFEALERLTGRRYESIETLKEDLPIEPPSPSRRSEWMDIALENSPQLMLAGAGVEVARSEVDISRSRRLPTVQAFARYNYADSNQNIQEGHDSASQLGVQASLPLYTGGTTTAQIRQSTYLLESSQYDFEDQRRDTLQNVRSLYTEVINDVQTVAARKQAIVSNRSALEATRSGYQVGTRNIVDVLNAEQNLFSAIADYAEARYDYVLARLNLQRQAGVLEVDDIAALNQWLTEAELVYLSVSDVEDMEPVESIGEPPAPPEEALPAGSTDSMLNGGALGNDGPLGNQGLNDAGDINTELPDL